MASSNIILILLYLSPFYRTHYKATIKDPTSVESCYYKARHTRLSDNCIAFAMSHSVDWTTIVTFTQGGKSDKTLTTTSQTLLQTPTLAPGRYIVFAKVGANVTGYNTDLGDLLASVDGGAHMEKFTAHSAWNQSPLVVNQEVSLTSSDTIRLTCWRGNSNGTIVATMARCSIFTLRVA